jgi:hypothetical protein
MSRFEEDGLNECDFCGNLWITCTCKEEDFNDTPLDPEFNKNIPQEVLDDESWDTKLLPDVDHLLEMTHDFYDIEEDNNE